MRDMSTAKLLLTGILAPILGLTKEKCESDFQNIKLALENRIKNGQSLAYGNLSWSELLKQISLKVLEKENEEYPEQVLANKWLGFSGASKEDILKTEERLNIKLPKEYRDFILASNGFYSFSLKPTLLSVDKIDWLKNLDPQLVKSWSETAYEMDEGLAKSFSNSILIGGFQEEQQLLLIPDTNSENWECWFFAYWVPGEIEYPNLRFYMEKALQDLEAEE